MNGAKLAVLVLAVAAPLVLPMLAGCGGKSADGKASEAMAERALESATGKDVDLSIEEEKVTIEGEGFKAELSQATEWPADVPPEVPEFEQGKVERVHKSEAEGRRSWNVYYTEIKADGPDRYAALLEQGGWKVQSMKMGDKAGMLSGERGNIGINFAYSMEESRGTLTIFTQGE